MARLPGRCRRLLEVFLIAVVPVQGAETTGLSFGAYDEGGDEQGALVLLDVDRARRPGSSWFAERFVTRFFKPSASPWRAGLRLEIPGRTAEESMFEYAVLHELGHVINVYSPGLPFRSLGKWKVRPPVGEGAFIRESWVQVDRGYQPRIEDGDAERAFYESAIDFVPRLEMGGMLRLYEGLAERRLPTLYALANPAEDFADSFATYVITVLRRGRYAVVFEQAGQASRSFEPGWELPAMAPKRRALEAVIGVPPPP